MCTKGGQRNTGKIGQARIKHFARNMPDCNSWTVKHWRIACKTHRLIVAFPDLANPQNSTIACWPALGSPALLTRLHQIPKLYTKQRNGLCTPFSTHFPTEIYHFLKEQFNDHCLIFPKGYLRQHARQQQNLGTTAGVATCMRSWHWCNSKTIQPARNL